MIDVHSHLIYNVDDGSKSLEESINIIKKYNEIGIKDIILTPHYITDTIYISEKNNNKKIMESLKKELKKENIDTNLYLGNEIYIDKDIEILLNNKKISSLNDSKYLLIELPMSGEYDGYFDIFLDLINLGYSVVLAHPERYGSFQKDFKKIYELKNIGVLFQCNIGSILGDYGKHSKKTIKRMMKEKLIYMFGTDIHHSKKDYLFLEKAKNKLKKYYTEEEIEDILKENARKIIN